MPNFNVAAVKVWEWISNFKHTLLGMWLLIHAGIKASLCQKKGLQQYGLKNFLCSDMAITRINTSQWLILAATYVVNNL